MNSLSIGPEGLAIAASLLLVAALVSLVLQLSLERSVFVAGVRTTVQLLLVGMLLSFVFRVDSWPLVLAILLSMVVNAGVAGVRRTSRRYQGIYLDGLLAVSVSCVTVTFVVTELVLKVEPWYHARYLIPLMGMVLGNTLTGLSLALDRILNDFELRRAEVEGWLALGATGFEACRPLIKDAARTGMIPILNVMSVAGIVSLPGMMTGQILAGADPMQAVQYQIVVMFMIAAAASLGALLASLLAYRRLISDAHQLALHRLHKIR